ncbi:response regulator transcription factor [Bombilactobacillus thymidiniphilus]|uniref:Response regulator transcription factor n=1 Tax=Bombilactobacillus thymidiniphilus TaxID=2923363 RepID=A0ABY4PFC3_9LACO|nr:response regulator transcription factor [Bombilactobacillus thymidiniphilus]UQS84219.1 response regulator transcription factor [Bombilactobacillus thymidiniphilus]
MKILVVDNDPDIVELLSIYIKNENYQPIIANSGMQALDKLQQNSDISLVILDIVLPDMAGVDVIKTIRQNSQLPIIVVSAKASDIDRIQGLMVGADDYIAKPFNPLEVIARMKSLLRRSLPAESSKLVIGSITIDKKAREVTTNQGVDIQLTSLEFGILYLLASHPNQVFSAKEIFEKVWQQNGVFAAKTVMVHVSHLRDKLEAATNGEKIIQTVWGAGYKAVAA